MKLLNSRLAAAGIVAEVLQEGRSLTAALEGVLSSVPSARDRALIQALCFGVCRSYHRLDFILNELVEKSIKDGQVRALALVGLYQLQAMRIKPHAAVSETVKGASKKPWAKALLNALLRNYLRHQADLEQKADGDPAAALSHPEWLIEQVRQDWPHEAATLLRENNRPPPMALRVNLSRLSREQYLHRLAERDIPAEPVDFCASAIVLTQPVPVESLPGFDEGLVSVQDVAAQMAAYLLEAKPGQRVLDVCAAPGGKTAHILELQPQLASLVAVDKEASRMERLGVNLTRLQLHAEQVTGDAAHPEAWWDGRLFDRILVDAPCSALGVVRRHPDIKLLRRADDIGALQSQQQSILQAVWPLLAPGGILLYATCSILKQENERQMTAFLSAHADAAEWPIMADWGIPQSCGRQILTGERAMDGFYYARLEKR
ncbi:16S rRNA (cytosine(967)-C(5))-methyltransferase RsmB [Methylosarcina fibrata]|uniref:16S rRNA (cytosine(967)-C(5))-methyltransferase RsmB n=1 Tax=Methylosarcina fibrata TaxID=105972 RepID=UPI00035E001B